LKIGVQDDMSFTFLILKKRKISSTPSHAKKIIEINPGSQAWVFKLKGT